MEISPNKIILNPAQMMIALAKQKHLNWEGGRGVGKSFGLGDRVRRLGFSMPRGKFFIAGRTYEQLLTRTLPSTLNGLNRLGLVKNLHYFVGNRPPKAWKWPEAYEPPLSYEYCLSLYNGATFQLVSLDKTESGRGFNFDGGIGDEAALLNFQKLQNNVLLSIRGNLEHFKDQPLHQSTMFASTTPVSNAGRWFTKREELAKEFPNEYAYLITQSYYNMKNLGAEYFRNLRRVLLPSVYSAEVDCVRNGAAEKPFYTTFDARIHTYLASNDTYLFKHADNLVKLQEESSRLDADVNDREPIDIAMDYNAAICWLVCGQMARDYHVLKSFFVKTPKTALDVAQEFCDYYKYHQNKTANYFYDHTAVGKDALRTTTTFAEAVAELLEKNGWTVNRIYCGQAPRHETKRQFFERIFLERDAQLTRVRINQDRNQYLIASIEQAGAIDGRDGVKKDKSTERDENVPDEEATHGSDAFDTLVFFKLNLGMQNYGYLVQGVA